MGSSETELLEYACGKFQEQKYDEALETFVLAYSKGIQQKWILDNIYSCYMEGNETEFQQTYEKTKGKRDISYDECLFDFIPYKDGEYYIFDKEMASFRGVFSIHEIEHAELNKALKESEFSGVTVETDWNLDDIKQILVDAKKRKIYIICNDIARICSYRKIPELAEYMENIMIFFDWEEYQDYFHNHTAEYLPKIFYGEEEDGKIFNDILKEEHEFRLTPEGRNTDNVLLTIGIPTYDRGNLLLKRLEHLQQVPYDAEIEFAISKNGTTLYQREYEQASKIEDARINYYDHGKELRCEENWHYTVEMSHGKYVLLVSDEDDVCLEGIEHYLRLLTDCSQTVMFRARGERYYSDIECRFWGKRGVQAFHKSFLRQNYISGLIFLRDSFLQERFLELNRFEDNVFYHFYPHEWWCSLLCLKGDYIEEPVQLFLETDSVREEQCKKYVNLGMVKEEDAFAENMVLPSYSTYEARFKQFQGQAEFLHFLSEKSSELIESGLMSMIGKLCWLIMMAREYNYKPDKYLDSVDEFARVSMNAMDEFQLSEYSKANILLFIKECVERMIKLHGKLSDVLEKEDSVKKTGNNISLVE